MEIRLAEEKDFPQLIEIENNIWTNKNSPSLHHYKTTEEYKKAIEGKAVAVAVEKEEVLGYVYFYQFIPIAAHRFNLFFGIGVKPSAQSQGVGTKLIDWLKRQAKVHEKRKLSLRVLTTNPEAISFYKRNGFVEEGRFKDEFFIDGHFVDDVQFAFFL
ncbi:MAG: GNAT family N-acetyltransferase [Lactobacillales bacterium]|nr:GNAT family N-acetyltransferase [Lactobacillales bacterium]